LGTPVVSYAPRPMLQGVASLVIMWDAEKLSTCAAVEICVERVKGEQAAIYRRSQESGRVRVWIDSRCRIALK
jgi:hypothetical protein